MLYIVLRVIHKYLMYMMYIVSTCCIEYRWERFHLGVNVSTRVGRFPPVKVSTRVERFETRRKCFHLGGKVSTQDSNNNIINI